MIYLASPYSDPDIFIREQRFQQACKFAGFLMRQGLHVYSPIAHSHPIAKLCNLPGDNEWWWEFNRPMIEMSDQMFVLTTPGWKESKGILQELEFAFQGHILTTLWSKTKDGYAGTHNGVVVERLPKRACDEN